QGWWKKWVVNGWVSSTRQPVANRDLWEPFVELYRAAPGRLSFRWVKGHGSDPYNELVDRLAVAAASSQLGSEGDSPPAAGSLGPADKVGRAAGREGLGKGRDVQGNGPELARQALAAIEQRSVDGPAGTKLRSARSDEAAAVVALWRAACARPGHTDDAQPVRALLAHDPEALIVAVAGEDLVGSLVAGWDGWRAHLYRMTVLPAWRRRGVASALVAEAERRLVAKGARRLGALVVSDDTEAVKFWMAQGFEPNQFAARYLKRIPT
ncbi:MAG TPA: GNAT family N-acetyltransferase, partial [Acidimicrobiales bacterium]|nr:GNAT family N-acetyltransferase [Acidimicrobiales bacterium]